MKRNTGLVFAVLILLVAACAPAGPSRPTPTIVAPAASAASSLPTPVTKAAQVSSPSPVGTPKPISVQVKADDKLGASAVISTTGGTLSATAADGTQFTLTMPKDALVEETKITLTPLASIEGLPLSGALAGAVQLGPEGLRLFQPATLTIESPRVVAAQGYETVGFGYHQSGEGLYLNPSQAQGNTLVLTVLHFSGAGAAQGTGDEIQAQYQRTPTNAEDALTQRMTEYLGQERQQQLSGQPADPELQAKIVAYQREYFQKAILPQLAVIRQDCEASKSLLPQALGWLRQVQLWGWGDQFRSESQQVYDAWDDGIVNCYNKEYDQCLIDKDIKHRTAMLNLLRLAQIGRSSTVLARLDPSKAWKCPQRSYRASGVQKEITYSGTVCDLATPFSVQATSQYYAFTIQFTPSGPQGGSATYSGTWFDVGPVSGSGAYVVNGAETDTARIVFMASHTTSIGMQDVRGNVEYDIDLVPIDAKQCN